MRDAIDSKAKASTEKTAANNNTIDIVALLCLIRDKLLWIIAFALIGGIFAYTFSRFFITPLYKATAVVYVNNPKTSAFSDTITNSEITMSTKLVPTYQTIVSTKTAMKRVIAERGIEGYTPAELLSMLSTSSTDDTGMFSITVTGKDRFYVADIANAVAEVGTLEISKYVEGSTSSVIDYAVVPKGKSYPSNTRNAVMGAIVGAVLCAAFVIIRDLMDTRLKKPEDLSLALGAPILGLIPDLAAEPRGGYKSNQSYGKAR